MLVAAPGQYAVEDLVWGAERVRACGKALEADDAGARVERVLAPDNLGHHAVHDVVWVDNLGLLVSDGGLVVVPFGRCSALLVQALEARDVRDQVDAHRRHEWRCEKVPVQRHEDLELLVAVIVWGQ